MSSSSISSSSISALLLTATLWLTPALADSHVVPPSATATAPSDNDIAESAAPVAAGIASAHYLASEAGHEILAAGGNAFDAAVAVSAALSVVEPASSGLGGGGFWLLFDAHNQRSVMVDGRETAPGAASRDMYLDEQGEVNRDLAVNGPLAAGIPGLPAALVHIARRYGELSLADSLAPAIRLAEQGFPVDEKYHRLLGFREEVMRRWPAASAIFLAENGLPAIGDTIRQPDLARTLRRIAAEGTAGFYSGETARLLVDGVREAGGIWTLDDLKDYRVVERQPVQSDYQGYRLITASPPSSGGVALATMLNILAPYPLQSMDRPQRIHLVVEAMRRAYRDRSLYLGDPDFVDVPVALLTDRRYAAGLRAGIRLDRATPSDMLPGFADSPGGTDTTHYSIIDEAGNLVAATQTVNLPYGAAFMAPGTGLLLNNEMDDFSAKAGEPNAFGLIGYNANAIEPGKRPLSSMSPTFVIGDERVAVLGTPGGSRIITMVLLGILEFVAGHGPEQWVNLPRYHHQYLPDQISAEPDTLDAATQQTLKAMGHQLQVRDNTWGNMHGVMWDRSSGSVSAASDPRWQSGRAIVRDHKP